MKARTSRTLFDRVCDAARIPEDRRHYLRTISNAMGLNEDEPAHVYLVVGEVVTAGLATHKEFMNTVPAQLRDAIARAAKTVDAQFEATIDAAAETTGRRIEGTVIAALDDLARRERRKNWPWFAVVFGVSMLLSVALGWSLAGRESLSSSLFWTQVVDTGTAGNWQRIIELNPQLPSNLAACGTDSTRVSYQTSRLACRTALWITPPSADEVTFFDMLLQAPALLFERHLLPVVGALGCIFGLGISGLLYWRWGKR